MQDETRVVLWLEGSGLWLVFGLVESGRHGIDTGRGLGGIFENARLAPLGQGNAAGRIRHDD